MSQTKEVHKNASPSNQSEDEIETHSSQTDDFEDGVYEDWSEDALKIAVVWMERSARMFACYTALLKRYERLNRFITAVYMIIATSSTGVVYFNVGSYTGDDPIGKKYGVELNLTVGSLSLLAAILAGFITLLKFSKNIAKYKYASKKFSGLVTKVENIVVYKEKRPPFEEFLGWVSGKYLKYQDAGNVFMLEPFDLRILKTRINDARLSCKMSVLEDEDYLNLEDDLEDRLDLSQRLNLVRGLTTRKNNSLESGADNRDTDLESNTSNSTYNSTYNSKSIDFGNESTPEIDKDADKDYNSDTNRFIEDESTNGSKDSITLDVLDDEDNNETHTDASQNEDPFQSTPTDIELDDIKDINFV